MTSKLNTAPVRWITVFTPTVVPWLNQVTSSGLKSNVLESSVKPFEISEPGFVGCDKTFNVVSCFVVSSKTQKSVNVPPISTAIR